MIGTVGRYCGSSGEIDAALAGHHHVEDDQVEMQLRQRARASAALLPR
jgi:hypothetical protein